MCTDRTKGCIAHWAWTSLRSFMSPMAQTDLKGSNPINMLQYKRMFFHGLCLMFDLTYRHEPAFTLSFADLYRLR